jgi:hypothetical protein
MCVTGRPIDARVSPVVKEVVACARWHLDKPDGQTFVRLIGHSYGGAIVTLAAMVLNNPRVSVDTFGSVYTPAAFTHPPRVTHHMFRGDSVAMRCNGLNAGRDASRHDVDWFGDDENGGWKVHNSYWPRIVKTMQTDVSF